MFEFNLIHNYNQLSFSVDYRKIFLLYLLIMLDHFFRQFDQLFFNMLIEFLYLKSEYIFYFFGK